MTTDSETIFTSDGKAFSREFRKFGDICLTETNERIFVCSLCRCLSVTPAQFWKHQRDEHEIRDYKDTVVNNSIEANGNEEHQTDTVESCVSNNCPSTNTRSSLKTTINGSAKSSESKFENNSDEEFISLKPAHKRSKAPEQNDSPLLKRALKQPPRIKTTHQSTVPIPSQNEDHFNNISSANDNFNEFITFCCPECGKRFQNDTQWKEHTATVHNFFASDQLNISLHKINPDGSKVFKCDICNVLLNKPNIAPLRRHKLIHMPFKSYCCRLCGTKIRHKSGIIHHVRSVHRKGKQKLLHCKYCLKSFFNELQYRRHFKLQSCGMDLNLTGASLLPQNETTTNTTIDESLGLINGMSCDGDYLMNGVSFEDEDENVVPEDLDYDPSAFLETEMIEDDPQGDELFPQSFVDVNIKDEPSEYNGDNSDLYTTLWQEDAALVAEERIQRTVYDANMNTGNKNSAISALTNNYECTVCWKLFSSKAILAKHLRGHGRKMDCRRCGVKISSIKALRRHLDLKRCKILNGKDNGNQKFTNSVNSTKSNSSSRRPTKDTAKSKINKYVDNQEKEEIVSTDTIPSGTTEPKAFKCEDCDATLETRIMLSLHGARSHGKTNCRYCGVKISTPGALRRHYDLKRCKAFK